MSICESFLKFYLFSYNFVKLSDKINLESSKCAN